MRISPRSLIALPLALLLLAPTGCGSGGSGGGPTPPTPTDDCIVGTGPEVAVTGSVLYQRLVISGAGLGPALEWRPARFVDVQVKGPYKEWIHTHTFESSPTGTLIRDHVQYQLPLTPLGDVVLPVIRLQLRRIFAYREEAARRLLIEGTE